MKFILKLLFSLLVIVAVLVLFAGGGLVKYLINYHSERLTGLEMKVAGAELNVLSGQLNLNNLAIKNPEGYTNPYAATVDEIRVTMRPGSIVQNKIKIDRLAANGLRIIYEGTLAKNNIQDIQKVLGGITHKQETMEGEDAPVKAGKSLEIRQLELRENKAVFKLGTGEGEGVSIPIRDIELTNLGTDGNGVYSAEVLDLVLMPLFEAVNSAAVKAMSNPESFIERGGKVLQDIGESIKGIFE